jgi:hypothetical protein
LLRHVAQLSAWLVVDYFASVSECLGTSRGSSHGSSSTISTMPHVRLLRNIARHVARLVSPLVVDYFTSRKLVVDYFAYAARPGASARRVARLAARRRLLRLCRASGCLGTSRGSSRLVVDYSVRRDFVLRPHWLYFSHAVRRDYLSRGNIGSTSTTPRAAATSSFGRIASTIHLD